MIIISRGRSSLGSAAPPSLRPGQPPARLLFRSRTDRLDRIHDSHHPNSTDRSRPRLRQPHCARLPGLIWLSPSPRVSVLLGITKAGRKTTTLLSSIPTLITPHRSFATAAYSLATSRRRPNLGPVQRLGISSSWEAQKRGLLVSMPSRIDEDGVEGENGRLNWKMNGLKIDRSEDLIG